jgi:hypothetical protein
MASERGGMMYYIYDNDSGEFYSMAFVDFEAAEAEMIEIQTRYAGIWIEVDLDIYKKIT